MTPCCLSVYTYRKLYPVLALIPEKQIIAELEYDKIYFFLSC